MENKRIYTVFVRRWWRDNSEWPNGLEPFLGRKKIIATHLTLEEAIKISKEWNNSHDAGRYSRKAEFSSNKKCLI